MQSRRGKWLVRLLELAIFIVALAVVLGSVAFAGFRLVCTTPLPDIDVATDIESFIAQDPYTAQDLILAAQHMVERQVGIIGYIGNGFTSGHYLCEENGCQLQYLEVDIGMHRFVNCFRKLSGKVSSTTFRFNIAENHVGASTYYQDFGNTISNRQLSISSPTMDEAMEMLPDLLEPSFWENYPVVRVRITEWIDYWAISIGGLNWNELTSVEVPFENPIERTYSSGT